MAFNLYELTWYPWTDPLLELQEGDVVDILKMILHWNKIAKKNFTAVILYVIKSSETPALQLNNIFLYQEYIHPMYRSTSSYLSFIKSFISWLRLDSMI